MKYLPYISAFLFISACLASFFFQYFSINSIETQLFNSDALYLPTLFKDILAQNGNIKDWFLTPAPYFFPDFLIFFISYAIFPGPFFQIFIFSCLQITATFFLVLYLSKIIKSPSPLLASSTALVALLYLAFTTAEPFNLLLNSAFHYGAFLSILLCTALWLRIQSSNSSAEKCIIIFTVSTVSYLTSLSDNLFILQFVAPLLVAQFVIFVLSRNISLIQAALLLSIIIASTLGSLSYDWIISHDTRYPTAFGTSKLITNLTDIISIIGQLLSGSPALSLVVLLYSSCLIYCAFVLLRRRINDAALLWLCIFTFCTNITTFGAVIMLSDLPVTARYLIPALFWPVITAALFLARILGRRYSPILTIICIVTLFSALFTSTRQLDTVGLHREYYPEEIACIDAALQNYHVRLGIAQYWDAKYVQNFSKLNLIIAQHFNNLDEMKWITSERYFSDRYDFAIISNDAPAPYDISAESIMRINGDPTLFKTCGDRSVLVYGHDRMRLDPISGPGDSYVWRACELPSLIGTKSQNCEMVKQEIDLAGYVTYGPYEPLKTGRYSFEIGYAASGKANELVGDWDVVVALPEQAKILGDGSIIGSDGVQKIISGVFEVGPEDDMQRIEVRTLSRAGYDLSISYIRITRNH